MASARQTPARQTPPRQTPPRQSRAYHRRQEEAREERFQRRVTLAAVVVLVLVGIMAGAGWYYFSYRPAHAHVLSVGNTRFDAETVAARAAFVVTKGDPSAQGVLRDPVGGMLDVLTREETLLQAGTAQVDALKDDEVNAALRKRMSVDPEASKSAYDVSYKGFMQDAPISKATFERGVRASVIGDKLAAKFLAALPDAGMQVHLQIGRSADKAQMEAILDAVKAGSEFPAEVVKAGLAQKPEQVDSGWVPLDTLPKVKDKLASLQAGQMTEPLQTDGRTWVVYRVVERDDQRKFDDAQKKQLSRTQVDAWIDSQRDPLHVNRDLDSKKEAWILKEIQRTVARIQAAAARQAAAKQAR